MPTVDPGLVNPTPPGEGQVVADPRRAPSDNGKFRQAKIEKRGMSAGGDDDVSRLDVAVNNALGMGDIKGVGQLDRHLQQCFGFERSALQTPTDVLPFKQLHHDERTSLPFSDVEHGTDVWVLKPGSGSSFTPKPLERLLVLGVLVGKELQRDRPVQTGVLRAVDAPHPTTSDLGDDSVMRDLLADHLLSPDRSIDHRPEANKLWKNHRLLAHGSDLSGSLHAGSLNRAARAGVLRPRPSR